MEEGPLQIDLDAILRKRIGGKKGRFLPRALTAAIERAIHQDELNEMLRITWPAEGSEFAARLYEHLDICVDVRGLENIPAEGRFIFASNHPLGGLDGIGLVKVLGGLYGDDNVRFLVNDMLMNVAPLRNVFLPINKYGSQGRAAAAAINEAFDSDLQMVVFPAGLVSRIQPDGGIRDLEWQKSFVVKAVKSKRDIIPVLFEGLNRPRFYNTARWRKKLGIKVNIEQTMLPAELCAARGRHYTITFGKPISWQTLAERMKSGTTPLAIAADLRAQVYAL